MKRRNPESYDCLLAEPSMTRVTSIFTSDFHLSARPADDYRWGIFDFLERLIEARKARYLFFLGDLCEDKDEHPAKLINRIMRHLRRLARALAKNGGDVSIFMLKGNHDERDQPFFKFLHRWFHGRVMYFTKPAEIGLFRQHFLFLPFTKHWSETIARFDLTQYDRVLIHQAISGAVTENGTKIGVDGIRLGSLRKAKVVIAGDQHVPQAIGNLTYCGAPHPIRFGDSYTPRVLVETDGEFESVPVPTIRKATIRVATAAEFISAGLKSGDKAKVEVTLCRSEFGDWRSISESIQRHADKIGITVASLKLVEKIKRLRLNPDADDKPAVTTNPRTVLRGYAKTKGVDQLLLPYAEELLNG